MALYYYHGRALTALFPRLYSLIKAERKTLPPQRAQAVVVGNLDTESYLRSAFIARDGVMMGIEFPFIEAAFGNFFNRAVSGSEPDLHEQWFSAPKTTPPKKSAGLLEIELAVLAAIKNPEHAPLIAALGYPPAELGELKALALAHKLAMKFREYLLHIPATMTGFAAAKTNAKNPPVGRLWQLIHNDLTTRGYSSALLEPEEFRAACRSMASPAVKPRLYLFGMPILSAFHADMLAALAVVADVFLIAADFSGDDGQKVHPVVAAKYGAYRTALEAAAKKAGAAFSAEKIPEGEIQPTAKIEFWMLPGAWRGAEILGDHWHELLRQNPGLRQTDIQAALTDLAGDYAAFEKALGARQLMAASRTRMYEKPDALAELTEILSLSGTLNRDLLLRYWQNTAVRKVFGLDAAKTELYRRALESAHGFRDDYPEAQNVYNLSSAVARLCRGSLVGSPAAGYPRALAAQYLREFETAETFQDFQKCLELLLSAPKRLGAAKGHALIGTLIKFFTETGFITDGTGEAFIALLQKIQAATPAEGLTLAQLTVLIERFAVKTNLKQGSAKEGILFSAVAATAFTAPQLVLFDLNEDIDRPEEKDAFLPGFDAAPTRLSGMESLYIALESARFSGAQSLVCGYSGIEPASGAAKYPSHALSNFEIFLANSGIATERRDKFAATALDFAHADAGNAPIAADADISTIEILNAHAGDGNILQNTLRPEIRQTTGSTLSVQELENFLMNPARVLLGAEQAEGEEPAEFRNEEPKLGLGNKESLKFCDDYLKAVLGHAAASFEVLPSEFIRRKQLVGDLAPEGFDQARLLLAQNDNDSRLKAFALGEREKLSVIEYILQAGIDAPFSVSDAPRLERRYLPAPVIGGLTVVGTLGRFFEIAETRELILLDSPIYPERTEHLVRIHLKLCLAALAAKNTLAGVAVAEYKLPEKKAAADILDPKLSVTGKIQAHDIGDAGGYLENLLEFFTRDEIIWFDLSLIKSKKLGGFADAQQEQICDLLQDEPKSAKAEKADYLRRFYNLKPNEHSFAFFQQFILPVAKIDAMHSAKKGKKGDADD